MYIPGVLEYMLYSSGKETVITLLHSPTLIADFVLMFSLEQIMSHSGAQGSIGSHSAIGLRNSKVPFYRFFNLTDPKKLQKIMMNSEYSTAEKDAFSSFLLFRSTSMNTRTSKVVGWTCSESAVTFVRRGSKELAPSGLRVDRKSTDSPYKYVATV